MIFATDLDRTLIFTKKSFGYNSEKDVFIDYNRLGDPISYIKKETLGNLASIIKKNINIIPVTARTKYKVERLLFKEKGIKLETFIYNNGVDIVYNNKRLDNWDNYVFRERKNVDTERIYRELCSEIKSKVSYLTSGILIKSDETEEILQMVESYKKLYDVELKSDFGFCQIVYKNINKELAIKALQKHMSEDYLVCAGDSKYDLGMINISDRGFALGTGNIIEVKSKLNVDNTEIIWDNSSNASNILTKKILDLEL